MSATCRNRSDDCFHPAGSGRDDLEDNSAVSPLRGKHHERVTPLPAEFLETLAAHDEVLVTSREGSTRGTVPTWFVIVPPGVVYLFGFSFSTKARRWRLDPWVRLTVPGNPGNSAAGVGHFVV